MTVQLDYDRMASRKATIVDVVTLIHRFAMSGDYTLEKLGGRFYPQAGRSVNDQELVSLVQSGLTEQAKGMPSFMTTVLQDRASEVAAKLVDDPVVVAAAAETFSELAEVQRAGGTTPTVEQTTTDLAVLAPSG